ncbi:MAG: cupin-like domain-containing protein [Polyangiales bacterium]
MIRLPSIQPSFSIDERTELSPVHFEREYVLPHRPVLVRGAMKRLPALRWTFDSIAAVAPQRKVPALFFPKGDPYLRETSELRMVELAAQMRTLREPRDPEDPYPYLICDIAKYLPELLPDASLARAPEPERCVAFEAFIGRDSITSTHFHPGSHAMVTQVRGEKTVILHPPEESRELYGYAPWTFHYSYSRARYDQLERFPSLARARATQVTLRPGDQLFIPTMWWHTVYAMGESITVSHFWLAKGLRDWMRRLQPRVAKVVWRLTKPELA